jgi:uncharacterized protein (DUF1778 family)
MATTRTKPAVQEEDEEVQPATNGRRPAAPRISITVTSEVRRNIRIAAAVSDKEIGEWCSLVLERAADKVIAEEG